MSARYGKGRVSADALGKIKLGLIGLLTACLLLAVEERLYWLRIPPLAAGAPWLGLLFVLATGFLFDSDHGAVAGVCVGFLADCLSDGLMLRPLSYLLLGFLAGRLAGVVLARNLPSFVVFAAVGAAAEGVFRVVVAAVSLRGIPPVRFLWYSVLPHIVMSVIFAGAIYGICKGIRRFAT